MVVELVPLKGGIGSIFHPPEGKDYKWYICGIFPAKWGDYMPPIPPFRGTRKAPVGRNDARASVFRPMETLQNVRFPARLSRKLSCGVGVGWDVNIRCT